MNKCSDKVRMLFGIVDGTFLLKIAKWLFFVVSHQQKHIIILCRFTG